MLFSGTRFGMVHVGDSRAYLLRDSDFVQVTKDDTYVQMLVDEGRISAEEASSHPQRSLLTRALDGRDIDPEYSVRQALPGDRYMICSDGLSGVVSAETIAETMREYVDPSQCVDRLVQLALRGGGPDNVTVIVADVTDQDIVEQRPIVGGAAARDRGMTSAVGESTPASRASALQSPRAAVPEVPDEEATVRRKRHPVRTTVLVIGLLAVLGGGLWYVWSWSQRQYYVGATPDGTVAVYQGIPGQIAGLRLSRLDHKESLTLDQLTNLAQDRVRKGISASSAEDAEQKYRELIDPDNGNVKRCSPTPSGSPSTSAGASPSTAVAASTPSSGSTGSTGTSASSTGSPSATGSPSPTLTPC
jgi:protein phosphatase